MHFNPSFFLICDDSAIFLLNSAMLMRVRVLLQFCLMFM